MRTRPINQTIDQHRVTTAVVVLIVIFGVFAARLFYVQIIRGSYYQSLADTSQRRKYEIAPDRGEILVLDGDKLTPLVLNEARFTLYADPRFIKEPEITARQLSDITGGDYLEYLDKMSESKRAYVILEKRITKDVAGQIRDQELRGIGLQDQPVRTYPEKTLAAHLLGFVNDEGQGQYGVEQGLQERLEGRPGLLNGVTDVRGIPIASEDTVQIPPTAGDDIILTIDKNVQAASELALQHAIERTKAANASIVVIDPGSGAIKAMANYPTFDPGDFRNADPASYSNPVVSLPYEQGSVLKVFAMAAGLQEGVVTPDSTYVDRSFIKIDDFTIRNAINTGTNTLTMTEVITRSANTGVIHVLQRLSGDDNDDISAKDKQVLLDYYHDNFRLDVVTNIGVGGEFASELPPVTSSDVRFANMTFGQGLTTTMLRTAASVSALVNGGVYYEPYVLHGVLAEGGKIIKTEPKVVDPSVVSPKTSAQIKAMMQTVIESGSGRVAKRSGYALGGKTGTAQTANSEGGYFEDRDIGSFIGVGPGEIPQYVVMVRIVEPQVAGFAGSSGAAPIFAELNDWLIEYYAIPAEN